MTRNTDKRTDLRRIYKGQISVQESNKIYTYRARMVNYSDKGMYIETDIALDEATSLIVGIEDSKFALPTASPDSPNFFLVIVLWRKNLKSSIFNFGYGSKIISVADDPKTFNTNLPVEQELRKHSRKANEKQIYFIERSIFQNIY